MAHATHENQNSPLFFVVDLSASTNREEVNSDCVSEPLSLLVRVFGVRFSSLPDCGVLLMLRGDFIFSFPLLCFSGLGLAGAFPCFWGLGLARPFLDGVLIAAGGKESVSTTQREGLAEERVWAQQDSTISRGDARYSASGAIRDHNVLWELNGP